MCRLAVHHGPRVPLSSLLYEPPTSLSKLAWAPQELQHGHVNVDGTGVAWWDPDDPGGRPLRYVTPATPWADANLPNLAPRIRAEVQIAAVRGATPGVPFGAANVAPFTYEGLAFAHNGWLGGFRKRTGRRVAEALPDDLYGAIDAVSDSLLVFLTIVARLRAGADGLQDAVATGLRDIASHLRDEGEPATLNTVTSDGTTTVITRSSVDLPTNSLYVAEGAIRWPSSIVVASERLDDDPAWQPVEPDTMLVIEGSLAPILRQHPFDPS